MALKGEECGFDPDLNQNKIIIHFPLYGKDKERFEIIYYLTSFFVEIDFSYLNPFNIVAHSKILVLFSLPKPYITKGIDKILLQEKIFFNSFEYFYQKYID